MANGLKWTGLIIATMVGAGYASGRELWEFFGFESQLAILLFAILFTISCFVILKLSYEMQSNNYIPVLYKLIGKRAGRLYDYFIFLYLFTTLFVMISGSGATFKMFHLPFIAGVALMIAGLYFVMNYGINGILGVNKYALPFLIGMLLVVLGYFVYVQQIMPFGQVMQQKNWSAAIPFTSLNVLPLVAVLGAIGNQIKSDKEIWVASITSGITLGGISFLYNESLVHVAEQLYFYDIPLFAILHGFPMIVFVVMVILLLFAIYTTAITCLFGLMSRLDQWWKWDNRMLGGLIIVLAVPFAFLGFAELISFLYPLFGVINLYVLLMILIYPIITRAEAFKI
ncbi:YkvI family membrane protein [Halalkalibacillus halophilus]|uniref:YkvI family membrane protein n=1 Tax=Halalkalibacillus halophilus TaxID=392827 RepID=UPI000411F7BB|nr:membrane protein [Halalkalibacillus halophilus]